MKLFEITLVVSDNGSKDNANILIWNGDNPVLS